jgi:hypothetical protein
MGFLWSPLLSLAATLKRTQKSPEGSPPGLTNVSLG